MLKRTPVYEDTQTGETFSGKIQFIDAAFDEEKGYLFWNRKKFAKSFQDVDFPECLSMADRGRLATLAKKMWSNTNMLGYRGNGGIRPYTVEQIGDLIQLKNRQARSFMRKMEELRIIKPIQVPFGDRNEVQYYMNPVYFFSSNRLSLNLYTIFHEELDAILPDWVKREYGCVEALQKKVEGE